MFSTSSSARLFQAYYRQDAAKRQPTGICFYSEAEYQHFAPCVKNYALDRKIIDTFYNGQNVLYHHAKLVEERTTRAGCRCENDACVFVFLSRSDSGRHAVRLRGTFFEQVLRHARS